MVKDILPQARKDENYFSKHQIDLIKSWGSVDTIEPTEINWDKVEPDNFPYKLRQRSGNKNALGLFKFNTPNAHAIFLHDTPSKSVFNREDRSLSSGCVRVQNASIFARTLLKMQGIDESKLEVKQLVSNKLVALKKKIPVHIIYQTAWYENGGVHYRDDIYLIVNSLKIIR